MLRHEGCDKWTLADDPHLLSKCAYYTLGPAEDQGGYQFYWSLSYVHERLNQAGEKRAYYKWAVHVKQTLHKSEFMVDDVNHGVHIKSSADPPGALSENVCSTKGMLVYLLSIMQCSKTPTVLNHVENWIREVTRLAMRAAVQPREVVVSDTRSLMIQRGGLVEGLPGYIRSIHKSVLDGLSQAWEDLHGRERHLCQTDESGQPLPVMMEDLICFLFCVEQRRKAARKHPWPVTSKTASVLRTLQRSFIISLSDLIEDYVALVYQMEHDVAKAPPGRELGTGRRKSKTAVPPETIWELLQAARESRISAQAAMRMGSRPSLSGPAAGAHEGSIKPWERRKQNIYNKRASLSFGGCCHFNIVADTSTHGSDGREILVAVAWSHENKTACHMMVQEILPGSAILPDEFSLVEALSRERKFQRVSSLRQLQAISHQIRLLSRRFALDDFQCPANVRSVRPGEERIVLQDPEAEHRCLASIKTADGIVEPILPANVNWFQNLPLLVLQLDQGSVGAAGMAFAITALDQPARMVQVRWDSFHRAVRDVRLGLQRSNQAFLRAMLHSAYIWSMSYRPFGSGGFHQSKQRILEAFLATETVDSFPPFVESWELIRDDLKMRPDSSMREVFDKLCDLETFRKKGTLPKMSRWFSWNQSAEENLGEFRAARVILKHAFREDGRLDPDDCDAQRQLSKAATGGSSKESLRKEFSTLKEQLGGGLKLAYHAMSLRLFQLCHVICICTRPIWTWYAESVQMVTNADVGLELLVMLSTRWHSEPHLKALASLPTSQNEQILSVLWDAELLKRFGPLDTATKIFNLTQHLLLQRCWSLSKHGGPPDCYAGLLSSDDDDGAARDEAATQLRVGRTSSFFCWWRKLLLPAKEARKS